MATAFSTTGASTLEPSFRMNGTTFGTDDPEVFIDQAHAVACCVDEATADGIDLHPEIVQSAVRAIQTLLFLARQSMNDERARTTAIRSR